jgi:hypothetical protein
MFSGGDNENEEECEIINIFMKCIDFYEIPEE